MPNKDKMTKSLEKWYFLKKNVCCFSRFFIFLIKNFYIQI